MHPTKLAVLFFAFLMSLSGNAFAQANQKKEGMEFVGFFLPSGNVDAGRQAFVDLHCTACHRVEGEPGLPQPVAHEKGPAIGLIKRGMPTGEIMEAILSPSHSFAPGVYPEIEKEGGLSRMGDFTQSMTVRQLIDLVAFLKSIQD